jgi:hypothetical protein
MLQDTTEAKVHGMTCMKVHNPVQSKVVFMTDYITFK